VTSCSERFNKSATIGGRLLADHKVNNYTFMRLSRV
jgi:hypothetical protein